MSKRFIPKEENIIEDAASIYLLKDEENESIVRLKRVGFENIIGVFNSNLNQIELKPLTSSLNSEIFLPIISSYLSGVP